MWIFSDIAQGLMAVGILLAVVDLLVFGFATFFLTLLGLGMLTSGALIYFAVLPDTTTSILVSVAAFTVIYSALLWKPLKNLQANKQSKKVSSDLTGMSFVLQQDVSPDNPGKYHYSGIDWSVETSEVITQGTEFEVIDLQVGVMKVKTK
jgi:membrane protein implicated in regulation of membrane protease activity